QPAKPSRNARSPAARNRDSGVARRPAPFGRTSSSLRLPHLYLAGAFACLIGHAPAQELKRITSANSADLSLEELINIQVDVVFAASKYEQKVTQAPASVSIVTADEFKKFGYRNVADVLRGMRSFYVSNDRQYSYLGSRGFQRPGDFNSRYLILIDGHRMNDNIFDASSFGNDGFLDIDLIDRVEVIR